MIPIGVSDVDFALTARQSGEDELDSDEVREDEEGNATVMPLGRENPRGITNLQAR